MTRLGQKVGNSVEAPLLSLRMGDERRWITVIYPYYENLGFMLEQMERWWKWRVPTAERTRLIMVDDGSPDHPMEEGLRLRLAGDPMPFDTRLFRVDVDVRWNWLAARNIGAHHARDGWILMTDMDHVIPEDTMDAVQRAVLDPSIIYRFSRREGDGTKIHPHPNSWLMTRAAFWMVGGYDEALSGHYGTDGEYRRRCAATAAVRIVDLELERHEHVGDSSTIRYLRKQPEDAAGRQIVRARTSKWRPRTLSFPYHEVKLP